MLKMLMCKINNGLDIYAYFIWIFFCFSVQSDCIESWNMKNHQKSQDWQVWAFRYMISD